MLDLKLLSEHTDWSKKKLKARGVEARIIESVISFDEKRKKLSQKVEALRGERNQSSAEVPKLKKAQKNEEAEVLIKRTREIGSEIKSLDLELEEIRLKMEEIHQYLPNFPADGVPEGADENSNKKLRNWGEPRPLGFKAKDHGELGEELGVLDLKRAVKIAGARFPLLRGDGVRLERALAQFMLDLHRKEHGYEEILPPFLVNSDSMFGSGQLPKFAEDAFRVEEHGYYMIPTSEVSLVNLYRKETLKESELPLAFTAFTPCFRSEAGSYGRDTRGLIRQHQFQKVELVWFCRPEESEEIHEKLTQHAEEVLKRLELPYQVMELSTGDMGFSAAKTYDLEVWLPGQNDGEGAFREISSCSNCTDFQARRAKIKYKPEGGGKSQFLHTLNGSGLAVGRTWIAVLENYQQEDGSILIPELLRPYMDGQEKIIRK
jgi:seryl-tRNA synthetase